MKSVFLLSRASRAFSLVELLLYVGILGIVGGLMTGILTTATKTQLQQTSQDKLSGELSFAMQTIQRLVQQSSLIDANAGTASSGLKLRMANLSLDPTLVYLSNGTIYIQQGSSTPQALTDNQVSVSSLQFQKFSQYPGKDVAQIDIAMTDASQPNALARSLRSAVSRASAATFDSPLLPGSNTYSIGDTNDLWGSGYFTGPVGIALGGQLGIGTLNPSYPLDVETANNGIFVSSTATSSSNFLLNLQAGTSTAFYVRNDGNIGIGTSTPAYPLDIQSSGAGVRIASTQNGSTTPLLNITASSSPVFYARADGNIGIGTSTPAYGLDIYDTLHVANNTSTFDGNIVFGGSTSTPVYRLSNVATPATSTDVATKGYVDSALASGSGVPSGYMILGPTSAAPSGYSTAGSGLPLTPLETSNYGPWTTKNASGVSTSSPPAGAGALNGYIYVASGGGLVQYNPATDTWNTSLATTTFISGINFSPNAIAVMNNKIYIFGWKYTALIGYIYAYAYDPTTNTWASAGSVALGSKISPNYVSPTTINGSIYVGYSFSNTYSAAVYGTGLYYYSGSSFSIVSGCGQSSLSYATNLIGTATINGNAAILLAEYYNASYIDVSVICSMNTTTTAISSTPPATIITSANFPAITSVANTFPYLILSTTQEITQGGGSVLTKPKPPTITQSGYATAVYYNGYIYYIGTTTGGVAFNYAYSDPLYYVFQKN